MADRRSFLSSWRERLSALRNVPVVLRIVWESGGTVVFLGVLFRFISALLPLALAWVGPKLIIDTVVQAKSMHQPFPDRLWYLVALEFGLAILASTVGRVGDYLDSLLADNYMRHVSIQVMKHAAELDLLAYEDPVFYDRLERARVQATDRLGMIQSIGRLIQQVVTHDRIFSLDRPFLSVAPVVAGRGSGSGISGRKSLRIPRLRQEFSTDPDATATRLSARAGRQQGSGQGAEAFRAQRFPDGALHGAFRPDLRGRRRLSPGAS